MCFVLGPVSAHLNSSTLARMISWARLTLARVPIPQPPRQFRPHLRLGLVVDVVEFVRVCGQVKELVHVNLPKAVLGLDLLRRAHVLILSVCKIVPEKG